MHSHPCRFGRRREGECIGKSLGAASVVGANLALGATTGEHILREIVTVSYTIIIQVALNLLVIDAGERDFVVLVGILYHLYRSLHVLHRALVHGYASLVKPSLLAQMLGKVAQERAPVFGVGSLAGLSLDKLYAIGSLVVVVEAQVPRNHCVAGDEPVDADVVHHEVDISVEDGIIERPRAVDVLDAGHHRVVMILGLSVPRLVHDARGDAVLSGIGKHLHYRAHRVEVFLAPQRYLIISGYRVGVLPEVEVGGPLLR